MLNVEGEGGGGVEGWRGGEDEDEDEEDAGGMEGWRGGGAQGNW
jgi:hypothetical protein